MSTPYYTLLTNIGLAKLLNAQALGTVVQWSHMAVGDGNGNPTAPTQAHTALLRERYRAPLNQLSMDVDNPSYLVAELVVPSSDGGWYVHEVGIFDTDGDLVAVANFPATYKPALVEGAARDLAIRVIVEVSNASIVQLKIDPAIVLASRAWVESNFIRRSKFAGGDTDEVLAKRSPAAEDFVWVSLAQARYIRKTAPFVAAAARRYLLVGTFAAKLPPVAGLPLGTTIAFIKDQDDSPTITADGAAGEQIQTTKGFDATVIFDINAEIILVWNGTNWEV